MKKADKIIEAVKAELTRPFHLNHIDDKAHILHLLRVALDKVLADEPRVDNWISVNERLPTKDDADENGKVLIYRQMNEGQKSLSKSVFDWFMVKNCDSDTHWQPLPNPPKTKADGK